MNKKEALIELERMNESRFHTFITHKVPRFVLTRIENRTSDWRDVLPKYYIKYKES